MLPLARARHYWKSALVVFVIVAAATAGATRLVKPRFRSETVILYRQSVRDGNGETDSAHRVGARLNDMVMSRQRFQALITENHLYPEAKSISEAVETMKKHVGFQVREGSTFTLWYDGPAPGRAQRVAMRLAETLIQDSSQLRAQEANETRRFFEEEQKRLAKEVTIREDKLSAFLRLHPEMLTVIPTPGGEGPAANPSEVFDLEMRLQSLREQQALLKTAPEAAANATPPAGPPPDILEMLRRAQADVAAARADFSHRKETLTEAHPDYVASRENLRQTEARLRQAQEAAAAARAATAPQRATADNARGDEMAGQIALMEKRLNELRRMRRPAGGGVRRAPEVEVEYQTLRREVDEGRARLAALDDKRFQAALLANLETSGEVGQLVILDPASLPAQPVTNDRAKVVILGACLAVALALGMALLRAFMDDLIFGASDATWLTSLPVLVAVPRQSERSR